MEEQHKHKHRKIRVVSSRDAFSSVAFWQMMVFIFLICFVWADETLGLTYRMFEFEEIPPANMHKAFFLTAVILTGAIIAVGHTYERQKAVIRRMLMSCEFCHRVMHEDGSWENVEEFFLRNYPLEMDHGACPDCKQMLGSTENKKIIEDLLKEQKT